MAEVEQWMSLYLWQLQDDLYDYNQQSQNLIKIGSHDHSPGQGKPIGTGGIAAGAITATQIANGTITNAQIAAATILGSNIAEHTVTGDASGPGTGNIAEATIESSNIASATIQGSNIASGTITGSNIAASTITGSEIAPTTITDSNIASATITGDKLVNATVTGSKVAASTIEGSNIDPATALTVASLIVSGGNFTVDSSGDAAVHGTLAVTSTLTANGNANLLKLTGSGDHVAAYGVGTFDFIGSAYSPIIVDINPGLPSTPTFAAAFPSGNWNGMCQFVNLAGSTDVRFTMFPCTGSGTIGSFSTGVTYYFCWLAIC